MAGVDQARRRYENWWVGKMCRCGTMIDFRKCTSVKAIGPPSFVYGSAQMYFEDGSKEFISSTAFRPRKCDVEIKED